MRVERNVKTSAAITSLPNTFTSAERGDVYYRPHFSNFNVPLCSHNTISEIKMADLILLFVECAGCARDIGHGAESRQAVCNRTPSSPKHFFLLEPPDQNMEYAASFGTICYCGKKYVRKTQEQGKFECPVCKTETIYKKKELSLHSHCCFVPLYEDMNMGKYVKCTGCGYHFHPGVLDWTQGPEKKEQAVEKALLHAIIRAMMVKGPLDPSKTDCIRRVYHETTKHKVTDKTIEAEVNQALYGYGDSGFTPLAPILDSEQKAMMTKAMSSVFVSDGDLERKEAEFLITAGSQLGMENAEVKEILQGVLNTQPSSDKKEALEETKDSSEENSKDVDTSVSTSNISQSTKHSQLPPGRTTYPPPGVQAGGEWGHGKHVGTASKSFMGTTCCLGIFLFPALLCVPVPLFFPCDYRDLYKVNGQFYDRNGVHIGNNVRSFIPYRR